jgi:hypothetical protein
MTLSYQPLGLSQLGQQTMAVKAVGEVNSWERSVNYPEIVLTAIGS